jgi:hypothetical protein
MTTDSLDLILLGTVLIAVLIGAAEALRRRFRRRREVRQVLRLVREIATLDAIEAAFGAGMLEIPDEDAVRPELRTLRGLLLDVLAEDGGAPSWAPPPPPRHAARTADDPCHLKIS